MGWGKNLQTRPIIIMTFAAIFLIIICFYTGDGLSVWANLGKLISTSDNSSEYKYGHEDELSVQTNYLRWASVKEYNLRFFF